MPGARGLWFALCCLSLLAVLLAACAQDGGQVATATPQNVGQRDAPTATSIIIPTLYPTFTREAQQGSTATPPPSDTPTPASTVDFDQPVVELRYQIPALGLDRRLEANVNGEVTVVDETQGLAGMRQNQGGVIIELQQALPDLELETLPEDCNTCVAFSYELPMVESRAQGWLTDTIMLASVENFTTAMVGPHFPEGTVLGLRRSASPFDVAHSLALTEEGQLWRWLATEPDIEPAQAAADVAPQLVAAFEALNASSLDDVYAVRCEGTSPETLYLNQGGEETTVQIRCPAFSLPSTLLPVYLQLDAALAPVIADQSLPKPPLQIPLNTMVAYRRSDGSQLTLGLDGAARVTTGSEVYSDTLGTTQVISLTEQLLDTEQLHVGVEAYGDGEVQDVLLVRGPLGMMEAAWQDGRPPEELELLLESLQFIYDELTGAEAAAEDTEETPESDEATATAQGTNTPEESSTNEPSATSQASATPEE